MERIRSLARRRNQNKERHSVPTRKKHESSSDREVHVDGMMGEAAAAEVLGVEISYEIAVSGDDGFDLLYEGLEVEVKTRDPAQGTDFAMYDTSDLKTDLGILCLRIAQRKVLVDGWTTRAHWKIRSQILEFGGEERKGIPRQRMLPMAFLID
jgi:hypothetical protein